MEKQAEPGIDVKRLKAGTRIFVETEQHVYEMKVVVPSTGLLEITSTDPGLRGPIVGQFVRSCYLPIGTVSVGIGEDTQTFDLENWIGKGLFMIIHFREGDYTSAPVTTAEVQGSGWKYTVF